MIKYMAVAVAVAVPVAVPVAGLTKRFFNHPKRFLNQCLRLGSAWPASGQPSDQAGGQNWQQDGRQQCYNRKFNSLQCKPPGEIFV